MGYNFELITEDELTTSIWSGGTTSEIYIYPKGSSYKALDFKWRISSATVDLDHSTFTVLPKIYRYITTLEGAMDLSHNSGELIHLNPFEIYEFSGEINTESFGKVRDFNLMMAPGCTGNMNTLTLCADVPLNFNLKDETEKYSSHSYAFFCHKEDLSIKIKDNLIHITKGNALIIHDYHKDHNPNIEISSNHDCKVICVEVGVLK